MTLFTYLTLSLSILYPQFLCDLYHAHHLNINSHYSPIILFLSVLSIFLQFLHSTLRIRRPCVFQGYKADKLTFSFVTTKQQGTHVTTVQPLSSLLSNCNLSKHEIYAVLCHALPFRAMLFYAMLCYAVLCCACCAVPCHAVSCYDVLCCRAMP